MDAMRASVDVKAANINGNNLARANTGTDGEPGNISRV